MLRIILFAVFFLATEGGAVSGRFGGERIVGGEDAAIEDAPYQAALILNDKFVCGGAIISSQVIISAAQCATAPANEWKIRVGSNKLHDSTNEDGQFVNVSKIIAHDYFDDWDIDYDVALFFTTTPLVMDGIRVRSIGLATQDQIIPDDVLVVATGWGDLQEGGPEVRAAILQKVSILTVSRNVCQKRYDAMMLYINTRSLCAGLVDEDEKGTCRGDTGGPLTAGSVLVGITSWGVGCARGYYPFVYTSVPALSDWIIRNMQV